MEYTQQSGYQQNKPSNNKKYGPFILIGIVVLLLIIFWSRITVTIPAGHEFFTVCLEAALTRQRLTRKGSILSRLGTA